MCCSTAAKITFNLYVMQPECYVWYEIRKDAVCSWVLDRELMTCPSSEPSDMIASMPHLPFPTLFPLLTKWLACKVTTVRPWWQRGSRTFQEAFLMLSQVWLLHLGSCFPPKGLMKASVPSSFVPPERTVTWWCSLSVDCILGKREEMLVALVVIGWSQGPLNKSVVIWRRHGEGLSVCIHAFELIHPYC